MPRDRMCSVCHTTKDVDMYFKVDDWTCNQCVANAGGIAKLHANAARDVTPIKSTTTSGFSSGAQASSTEGSPRIVGRVYNNPTAASTVFQASGQSSSPSHAVQYIRSSDGSYVAVGGTDPAVQRAREVTAAFSGRASPVRAASPISSAAYQKVASAALSSAVPTQRAAVLVRNPASPTKPSSVSQLSQSAYRASGSRSPTNVREKTGSLLDVHTQTFVDPHHRAYHGEVTRSGEAIMIEGERPEVTGTVYTSSMPTRPLLGAPGSTSPQVVTRTSAPRTSFPATQAASDPDARVKSIAQYQAELDAKTGGGVSKLGITGTEVTSYTPPAGASYGSTTTSVGAYPSSTGASATYPAQSSASLFGAFSSQSGAKSIAQYRAEVDARTNGAASKMIAASAAPFRTAAPEHAHTSYTAAAPAVMGRIYTNKERNYDPPQLEKPSSPVPKVGKSERGELIRVPSGSLGTVTRTFASTSMSNQSPTKTAAQYAAEYMKTESIASKVIGDSDLLHKYQVPVGTTIRTPSGAIGKVVNSSVTERMVPSPVRGQNLQTSMGW